MSSALQNLGRDFNKINWRSLDESRESNPVIESLLSEAMNTFILKKGMEEPDRSQHADFYIRAFNTILEEDFKKSKFRLSNGGSGSHVADVPPKKGGKQPAMKKAELIKQQNAEEKMKKTIKIFREKLVISSKDYMIQMNDTYIESFLSVVYWTLFLVLNKEKNIPPETILNGAVSLYRAIEQSSFLTEQAKRECTALLQGLNIVLEAKLTAMGGNPFDFLLGHLKIMVESHWDKIKPNKIALYPEQLQFLEIVTKDIHLPKLILLQSPPATGKTTLSIILSRLLHEKNKTTISKKTILYVCYNSIVRTEICKNAIIHGIDVKYWVAITKFDANDNKRKLYFRPHKSAYADWNKKRSESDRKLYEKARPDRFCDNVLKQWNFAQHEIKPHAKQNFAEYLANPPTEPDIEDGLPEIILADLESAHAILKEPKLAPLMIVFFDEPTASIYDPHMPHILNNAFTSILVSATLPKVQEIPAVVENFRIRHGFPEQNENAFLHILRSNRQFISCTFIGDDGNIFYAHSRLKSMDEIPDFLLQMEDEPLIKRSYSPEVVFHMIQSVDGLLPEELRFRTYFREYGMITHESIRDYACVLLRHVGESRNEEIWNILKNIRIQKIENIHAEHLFTKGAINYQNGTCLNVSLSTNFNRHIDTISTHFLDGSPRVQDIMNAYDSKTEALKKQISSTEKATGKDCQEKKMELQRELNDVRMEWPAEYILNSKAHAHKYKTLTGLHNPNAGMPISRENSGELEETREKLLYSGVGIYQPQEFSEKNMEMFMQQKDMFKLIVSNEEIVYGTNIGLSIIIIDKSFLEIANKNNCLQMCGRSGRIGKSDSATIIVQDSRIFDIILEKTDVNAEAKIMNDLVVKWTF